MIFQELRRLSRALGYDPVSDRTDVDDEIERLTTEIKTLRESCTDLEATKHRLFAEVTGLVDFLRLIETVLTQGDYNERVADALSLVAQALALEEYHATDSGRRDQGDLIIAVGISDNSDGESVPEEFTEISADDSSQCALDEHDCDNGLLRQITPTHYRCDGCGTDIKFTVVDSKRCPDSPSGEHHFVCASGFPGFHDEPVQSVCKYCPARPPDDQRPTEGS